MPQVNKERAQRAVLGTCIALKSATLEAKPTEGGVWNVLAYEVDLKGRDVVLAKQHLEECVKNFTRYPKVPVVIEHADTDWWNDYPAEYAEPHGWITELRLNESFTRADGRVVCALEGRMALDDETKGEVNADPPKWPFGSVTIFFDQRDEESGDFIGAVLWSFSLTAHPALVDVPRLAASARINPETKTMNKFLLLAAALGLAALPSEEAAQEAVAERAKETADARKALGLSATASKSEMLAKIAELSASAAKADSLEKEVATHRAEKAAIELARRNEHVNDVIAADPHLETARAALSAFATADYEAFSKAHPRPEKKAPTEAPKGAHLSSLEQAAKSAKSTATAPATDEDAAKLNLTRITTRAHELLDAGLARTYAEALGMAEDGV